jgi:hypothetical protein
MVYGLNAAALRATRNAQLTQCGKFVRYMHMDHGLWTMDYGPQVAVAGETQ